jgi:hypothetical protein
MTTYTNPAKAIEILNTIESLYKELYSITEKYEILLSPRTYEDSDYALYVHKPINPKLINNSDVLKRFKTKEEAKEFIIKYEQEDFKEEGDQYVQ